MAQRLADDDGVGLRRNCGKVDDHQFGKEVTMRYKYKKRSEEPEIMFFSGLLSVVGSFLVYLYKIS